MRNSSLLAALAILVTLSVAACSGGATPNGSAIDSASAPPASSPAQSALPHSGAPSVSSPIDTSALEKEPCSVISEKQFKSIGIKLQSADPQPDDALGSVCDWTMAPSGSGLVGGTFLTSSREGLSAQYKKKQDGDWAYFNEIGEIGGHPAVSADANDDRRNGFCTVQVGVRDDLTYVIYISAGTSSAHRAKPCELAEKLAALAVETMKG